jgi:hypothetical protein
LYLVRHRHLAIRLAPPAEETPEGGTPAPATEPAGQDLAQDVLARIHLATRELEERVRALAKQEDQAAAQRQRQLDEIAAQREAARALKDEAAEQGRQAEAHCQRAREWRDDAQALWPAGLRIADEAIAGLRQRLLDDLKDDNAKELAARRFLLAAWRTDVGESSDDPLEAVYEVGRCFYDYAAQSDSASWDPHPAAERLSEWYAQKTGLVVHAFCPGDEANHDQMSFRGNQSSTRVRRVYSWYVERSREQRQRAVIEA